MTTRTRGARAGQPLPPAFYDRDTRVVARELLGALLECHTEEGVCVGRIVETEAYLGADDPACHAAAGVTQRTRDLHGPPGTSYVYFIYGAYWCFNAVTEPAGVGSAVLVRAVEPVEGVELMRARRPKAKRERDLTNGPGKLCTAMGITGALSGLPIDRPPILVRAGAPVPHEAVIATPRIGITRAAERELRWLVAESEYVSKTPKDFPRRRLG